MSLYSDWMKIAQMDRSPQDTQKFWDTYFSMETENYKKILENHTRPFEGALSNLAQTFDMDDVTFTGFLDGINSSLKQTLDLESLTSDTPLKLEVDFQKLYYNMLDAKANWLYTLPEWDAILTLEERKTITKEFRSSQIYVNENTVGRNDPCPCGSGKKYKKCCGK